MLLHVMLHVGDLERSIDFYTRALGMRVLRRREAPAEGRRAAFVGYDEERAASAIELTSWAGVPVPEHARAFGHVAIGVADASAACEAIRAGGGHITQEPTPIPSGTAIVAFTADPDGYSIELVERLPSWPYGAATP